MFLQRSAIYQYKHYITPHPQHRLQPLADNSVLASRQHCNMKRNSHPTETKPRLDDIQTTTNLQKPHTSLNITQISQNKSPQSTTPRQFKKPKILQCFHYIIISILAIIGIVIVPALLLLTSIALIPLLLTALFVIRLLQVFKKGHEYYKIIELSFLIRLWLLFDIIVALLTLYISLVIVNNIPSLENKSILDIPRIRWFQIICMMYGFYALAFLLNVVARYIIPPFPVEYRGSGLIVRESVCEVINCMVFWWAKQELFKRVPVFARHQILGLEIGKLISLILLLIIGNSIISIFTHMIIWSLRKVCQKIKPLGSTKTLSWLGRKHELFHRDGLVYWAKGVKWSINFILTILSLLLVWVLYLSPRLTGVKRALHLGTLTITSLLVCSFLWLIKTCVMRSWEARAVFGRFKEKILRKRMNIYFVGMVGCQNSDLLRLGEERVFAAKREEIKELLMEDDENLTMFDLQQIAQCLIVAKKTLLEDKSTSEIHDWWVFDDLEVVDRFKEHFRKLIVNSSADKIIEGTTMENARDSCISLANMLSSEHDAFNCLNNIISGLIIVATILLWLLLTGLATIQLLILSASPLLAATFIFGETLKNLFQGIVFVYAVNPFDIGDLCTIEGQLMEVKSVGVWKTTFTLIEKLGILEEIIYPNSELAKKTIINYRTEFDWDEFMEFNVGLLGETHVKQLKKDIESHLKVKKDIYAPNSHSVVILATGEKIKIIVKFKYVNCVDSASTYFACLQMKDKLRSDFSLYVHNLVHNLPNVHETTGAPSSTSSTTMNNQPTTRDGNDGIAATLLNQGNIVAAMETMGQITR